MGKSSKNTHVTLHQGDDDIDLDYAELRRAVLVLRAINHDLRRKIIELLENKEVMTVTDIYCALRVEQSVASQHLAILRKADIVINDREGKYINYRLNRDRFEKIAGLVQGLAGNSLFD
ncbi:MAG: metalloregulator ArsR/SmtB family transcription factor [Saprospiraceae bacterium]